MNAVDNFTQSSVLSLELDWIEDTLVIRENFSRPRARQAVLEYRAFLDIAVTYPENEVAVTKLADKAWHVHILNTRRYADDCEAICGHFLHHDPDAFGTEEYFEAWKFTRREFEKRGIELVLDTTSLEEEGSLPEFMAFCLRSNIVQERINDDIFEDHRQIDEAPQRFQNLAA